MIAHFLYVPFILDYFLDPAAPHAAFDARASGILLFINVNITKAPLEHIYLCNTSWGIVSNMASIYDGLSLRSMEKIKRRPLWTRVFAQSALLSTGTLATQ